VAIEAKTALSFVSKPSSARQKSRPLIRSGDLKLRVPDVQPARLRPVSRRALKVASESLNCALPVDVSLRDRTMFEYAHRHRFVSLRAYCFACLFAAEPQLRSRLHEIPRQFVCCQEGIQGRGAAPTEAPTPPPKLDHHQL
jgi:hypothetical protein